MSLDHDPRFVFLKMAYCLYAERAWVRDRHHVSQDTRLCVFDGRPGLRHSLGSYTACLVTLFLGHDFDASAGLIVVTTAGVLPWASGVAVTPDGATLLVADSDGGSHAIHEFRVSDGARLRVAGGVGDGPLQFRRPCQLWVAPEGDVYVADSGNDRIQVLTPQLAFRGFVGAGRLHGAVGVCGTAAIVAVSEQAAHRISIFCRQEGALLRRFGCQGAGDGMLQFPTSLCAMASGRHLAVADTANGRVSVFDISGDFERHVGADVLAAPVAVACSSSGELAVADGHSLFNFRHRFVYVEPCDFAVTCVATFRGRFFVPRESETSEK